MSKRIPDIDIEILTYLYPDKIRAIEMIVYNHWYRRSVKRLLKKKLIRSVRLPCGSTKLSRGYQLTEEGGRIAFSYIVGDSRKSINLLLISS